MRLLPLLPVVALLALGNTARAATMRSQFVTSDHVRLSYLEAGDRARPLIVFEPGWMCPAWIWDAQLDFFAKTHHAVALDPRAQGESDRPTEGHYPERRARDLKELVDHLTPREPVVLVGWSMGCGELVSYAEQFGTGGVRAFVLVDGLLGGEPTKEDLLGRQQWLAGLQADKAKFLAGFMGRFFVKPPSAEYVKRLTADIARTPTNSAVLLAINQASKNFLPALAKVDKPVLYICQPQMGRQAEQVKAALPSARIEVFDGCAHALFVEVPTRFNASVERFLAETR